MRRAEGHINCNRPPRKNTHYLRLLPVVSRWSTSHPVLCDRIYGRTTLRTYTTISFETASCDDRDNIKNIIIDRSHNETMSPSHRRRSKARANGIRTWTGSVENPPYPVPSITLLPLQFIDRTSHRRHLVLVGSTLFTRYPYCKYVG